METQKEFMEVPCVQDLEITKFSLMEIEPTENTTTAKNLLLDTLCKKGDRKARKKAQKAKERKEKEEKQYRLLQKKEDAEMAKAEKRCHKRKERREAERLRYRNYPSNLSVLESTFCEVKEEPPICKACKGRHW